MINNPKLGGIEYHIMLKNSIGQDFRQGIVVMGDFYSTTFRVSIGTHNCL